ncbi:hypothetical protein BV25DRAFT_1775308, partial [Artomyces pyxidatus]
FSIREALPTPTTMVRTVQELHELVHQNVVDLQPDYQRGKSCISTSTRLLINSLLKNLYIPPLLFVVKVNQEGYEELVCLDGKQCLTAIQEYLDGIVTTRRVLSETRRKELLSRGLVCGKSATIQDLVCTNSSKVQYPQIPDNLERQLFIRVQMGVPLSTAEKLRAISTSKSRFIHRLESTHVASPGGLGDSLDITTKRSQGFLNLVAMAYSVDKKQEQPTVTAKNIKKWLEDGVKPTPAFKKQIELALTTLLSLAQDHNLKHAFKSFPFKLSPVEFIFLGVLLVLMQGMKKFTNLQLADAILYMRAHLRKQHIDLRLNSTVSKSCWKIIMDIT